jgi:hypothetical protein
MTEMEGGFRVLRQRKGNQMKAMISYDVGNKS